jgi:hypothetical protein
LIRADFGRSGNAALRQVLAADQSVMSRFGAFLQALVLLGWTIGRNVHIDPLGHEQSYRNSQACDGTGRARARIVPPWQGGPRCLSSRWLRGVPSMADRQRAPTFFFVIGASSLRHIAEPGR